MNPGFAAMFRRTDEVPLLIRRKIGQWLWLIWGFDPIRLVVCTTTRTVVTARESAIEITQLFNNVLISG